MKDLKDMTAEELREHVVDATNFAPIATCTYGIEAFDVLARRLAEAERKLAEAEENARQLLIACVKAHGYLVLYHRFQNAPSTRWTWDTDAAKGAFEALHAAIKAQNRGDEK